ncbi:hypothetical protein STTU_1874 [Streptomyces sp. Tu6071]|nr:hypothetical protein STTU_1874 [Streptomyces sp. Tu6071]
MPPPGFRRRSGPRVRVSWFSYAGAVDAVGRCSAFRYGAESVPCACRPAFARRLR